MDFATALRYARTWRGAIPGVEAISEGIEDGQPCITVFVSSPASRSLLPTRLGAWKVVVQGAHAHDGP